MLTKKHFVAIAEVLRIANRHNDPAPWIARELADLFKRDNPRFDRTRFLKAAGVET